MARIHFNTESYVGIGIIVFGIFVDGVGIPVIPLGIYFVWRGYVRQNNSRLNSETFAVEKSPSGKIGVGVLLILVGVDTSTLIIGIPILLYGLYLIVQGIRLR